MLLFGPWANLKPRPSSLSLLAIERFNHVLAAKFDPPIFRSRPQREGRGLRLLVGHGSGKNLFLK